jgi:Protein of unknown function (DUF3341)
VKRLYGVMGMYADVESVRHVLEALRSAGCMRYEVFSPFPAEELDELVPGKTRIGWVMLAAGICGAAGAYFLQWYAAHDYPLNVGGRPLHSWPSFVPVTFELTVLTAALVGVAALFLFTRLTRLDYPTFNDPRFLRASQDRFFVCVHTSEIEKAGEDLRSILNRDAESVEEVYA